MYQSTLKRDVCVVLWFACAFAWGRAYALPDVQRYRDPRMVELLASVPDVGVSVYLDSGAVESLLSCGGSSRGCVLPKHQLGPVRVVEEGGRFRWDVAQHFSNKVREASYRHIMQPEQSDSTPDKVKLPGYSTKQKGKRIEPCWADRTLYGLGCPGPMVTRPPAREPEIDPNVWRVRPDGSRCVGDGCGS